MDRQADAAEGGAPPVRLSRVRQIAVRVRDLSTALPFYRDVLGLGLQFQAGPDLAFLSAGEVRLMLSATGEEGVVGGASVLYFAVPDVGSAHREIVARGATDARGPTLTARMPDHELWIAFVRDPDGNLIGLMEERPLTPEPTAKP
jgi:predicted enzyme related to lactoylglutathione lyase